MEMEMAFLTDALDVGLIVKKVMMANLLCSRLLDKF